MNTFESTAIKMCRAILMSAALLLVVSPCASAEENTGRAESIDLGKIRKRPPNSYRIIYENNKDLCAQVIDALNEEGSSEIEKQDYGNSWWWLSNSKIVQFIPLIPSYPKKSKTFNFGQIDYMALDFSGDGTKEFIYRTSDSIHSHYTQSIAIFNKPLNEGSEELDRYQPSCKKNSGKSCVGFSLLSERAVITPNNRIPNSNRWESDANSLLALPPSDFEESEELLSPHNWNAVFFGMQLERTAVILASPFGVPNGKFFNTYIFSPQPSSRGVLQCVIRSTKTIK